MAGHKNEQFIKIGWIGAKLDDAMNYIPARLSLPILFLGALIGRFYPIDGLRVALRDKLKHDSPNSAHPESFFAGALHIRLAGPIKYSDGIKNYLWLGAEYGDPDVEHLTMSKRLIKVSSWITVIIVCAILFLENI
jgi:adenosylcobinamide-phosphate synthase